MNDEIFSLIEKEKNRQENHIELIASENIVSKAVLRAQGSILTNKYAEGYPGKRYYGGCHYVDQIEDIAIARAKKLFQSNFANVQPHSGTQANQAVFFALLQPFDKILALSLDCGGHLTHGSKVNQSGKWFEAIHYGVSKNNNLIDMNEVRDLSLQHRPKLIIAGCSAYPRFINFQDFRAIADEIGAYLLVDMAHFAGLVAAKEYANPLPYADVVTSTTHKTLRGPRGGIILTNNREIAKKIQSAVFPGSQGGPLMHVIAAKAICFAEAMSQDYQQYIKQVVINAKSMSQTFINRGYQVLTGGTDCHLLMLDLRNQRITGKAVEEKLDYFGIACNKNTVPFDDQKPTVTSGIRIGTPAITTRGFKERESIEVANIISDVLDEIQRDNHFTQEKEREIRQKISHICESFPIDANE